MSHLKRCISPGLISGIVILLRLQHICFQNPPPPHSLRERSSGRPLIVNYCRFSGLWSVDVFVFSDVSGAPRRTSSWKDWEDTSGSTSGTRNSCVNTAPRNSSPTFNWSVICGSHMKKRAPIDDLSCKKTTLIWTICNTDSLIADYFSCKKKKMNRPLSEISQLL